MMLLQYVQMWCVHRPRAMYNRNTRRSQTGIGGKFHTCPPRVRARTVERASSVIARESARARFGSGLKVRRGV